MLDKRIGAQLYTLRDYCTTIEDYEKTCKKLKDIGYKMIQISAVGPKDGAMLKSIADKYGLEPTLTHCSNDNYLKEIDWVVKYHNELGCKIAGLGAMPNLNDVTPEEVHNFAEKFNVISSLLKEKGLTFAYHNHDVEYRKTGDKTYFDIILEETDPDCFKLIFDTYWAYRAGVNPADFIRKHKGRIICVHLKDMVVMPDGEVRMAAVGDGEIDWDDIISACNESGVQYAYVEQDLCYDDDPFECMKRSYEYLTKKGFC